MNLSYTLLSQEGNDWIFAFYGYGQRAEVYDKLANKLQERYNFLVIHLPYKYEAIAIEKDAFKFFIEEIITKYQIHKAVGVSYSVGSRFNLVLAECIPERISKLILIAPDGVKNQIWKRIITKTKFGNWSFLFFVGHKNAYLKMLSFLYQIKLISKSIYAFTKWNMRDEANRTKVYNVWHNMKNLIPNLKSININKVKYSFDIIAYFGKYDNVINASCMKKLKRKIPTANIVLLPKDHNLLDDELFDKISNSL